MKNQGAEKSHKVFWRWLLVFSIILLCPLMSAAQAENGLVAKYTFNNGNTNDEKGGNNAKAVGVSLVDDRFGNPRSAYYLHGDYGSYLNLGTGPVLKPVHGSISVWLKIENAIEAGQGYLMNPVILTKCDTGDNFFEAYCIYLNVPSKKIVCGSTLGEINQVSLASDAPVSFNEWHHVVLTYNYDEIVLYLDGVLQNRMSKKFETKFLEGDSVMVGNSANTKNKRFLNGSIDDIFIYDRVLTPPEVYELCEAPNPNKGAIVRNWILIICTALFSIALVVFLIIRTYQRALARAQKEKRLQGKIYEMELKAIKAQMNPHFIFNSLNTIQQFILAGDNENAYTYLARFSKLVRKILETSASDSISVENEMDLLGRYAEIEKLRFQNGFEFKLECDERIFAAKTNIPPMMIQPFVENAIWHGLAVKKNNRTLSVEFSSLNKQRIICRIDDNGAGRMAGANKTPTHGKSRSLATDFIIERLNILSAVHGLELSVQITDKKNPDGESAGTLVEITLPVLD